MKECHLVSGPPASGKTCYARKLAMQIGGCLIDSDELSERLIRAGLALAGMDPDDRDSPAYKQAYRQVVYETMYDVARSNLATVPVVLAGPFTREGGEAGWLDELGDRLGVKPLAHFIWCDPASRKKRIVDRGEARDRPKLEAWNDYLKLCREDRPVWPHHFVDTSDT
ncbi:AAA family ATPase [Haloferula chungangensis]|uniref:AAA family ATPase n=1 Tax=Haloferula chungangensis TaxID=1048331 RepID=A0ABW2L4J8_9BACT